MGRLCLMYSFQEDLCQMHKPWKKQVRSWHEEICTVLEYTFQIGLYLQLLFLQSLSWWNISKLTRLLIMADTWLGLPNMPKKIQYLSLKFLFTVEVIHVKCSPLTLVTSSSVINAFHTNSIIVYMVTVAAFSLRYTTLAKYNVNA